MGGGLNFLLAASRCCAQTLVKTTSTSSTISPSTVALRGDVLIVTGSVAGVKVVGQTVLLQESRLHPSHWVDDRAGQDDSDDLSVHTLCGFCLLMRCMMLYINSSTSTVSRMA
jgi:hypothetical protein